MNCPLCESHSTTAFFEKVDPIHGIRKYFKCHDCLLIFLLPEAHLSPEDEKQRYDQHQNNPDNVGYVKSLKKLVVPLSSKLRPASHGLDFGCGPQSVLKLMFEELGHSMDLYDPFYFNNEEVLRQRYDFVACTEVVEHFYSPQKEFITLNNLLKTQGSVLGIMTQLVENENDFRDWWYHRDPTHVCFYRRETFQWIASWKRFTVEYPDANIVILTK